MNKDNEEFDLEECLSVEDDFSRLHETLKGSADKKQEQINENILIISKAVRKIHKLAVAVSFL